MLTVRRPTFAVAVVVVVLRYMAAEANQSPVLSRIRVSPDGVGLQSATVFKFVAEGVSDPDGDPLTYTWKLGDGTTVSGGPKIVHVFDRARTFTVTLVVSDGQNSVRASRSVTVRGLSGRWSGEIWFPDRGAYCPKKPFYLDLDMEQQAEEVSGIYADGVDVDAIFRGEVSDPRKVKIDVRYEPTPREIIGQLRGGASPSVNTIEGTVWFYFYNSCGAARFRVTRK